MKVKVLTNRSGKMEINHEPGKFSVREAGGEAVLLYRQDGDTIDLYHTFTPEKLRGKGIAAKLTQAAFEYAKENDLTVVPTCPYEQKFLKDHEEWKSVVK